MNEIVKKYSCILNKNDLTSNYITKLKSNKLLISNIKKIKKGYLCKIKLSKSFNLDKKHAKTYSIISHRAKELKISNIRLINKTIDDITSVQTINDIIKRHFVEINFFNDNRKSISCSLIIKYNLSDFHINYNQCLDQLVVIHLSQIANILNLIIKDDIINIEN